MFTANEEWSRRSNERGCPSTPIRYVLAFTACLISFLASAQPSRAQVPTYEVTPEESTIKFGVDSSVSIKGVFEKWNTRITFSSREVKSAAIDIEIEADSVNTGSHMKDNKLKSKDFFNVKESPLITFKSTKIVQTGPYTFDIEGTSPFAASPGRRNSPSRATAKGRPPAVSTALWLSIAKSTA